VDALAVEAIARLTAAVSSLLPAPADPALAPSVLVTPVRVAPTGLGGYVGVHDAPGGEVLGRRLSARVGVTVRAPDAGSLGDAVALTTRSVLARHRATLAQLGILRVGLDSLGPPPPPPSPGPPQPQARDVVFDVLFEYLHLPVEAGGIIAEIPLDADVTLAARPRLLRRGPFTSPDVMTAFEVVDDPAAGQDAPSDWRYDAAEQAIRQHTLIRGGPGTPTARKPGTYLLLRTGPALPPVHDFSLATEFRSMTAGGVGVVFGFRDVHNFCFALLDAERPFRMIARKEGGSFRALAAGGLDTARGFDTDRLYTLRVAVQAATFRLLLDGVTVLEATDDAPAGTGRVGLMTRACEGARFYDLTLMQL
jgi:hypothetical protein